MNGYKTFLFYAADCICPYLRHRDELGLVDVPLRDVGEAGEDEHAHDDHEHEEAELLVAVLQREAQGLQARDVAGELEYSQDSHDTEDLYGHIKQVR